MADRKDRSHAHQPSEWPRSRLTARVNPTIHGAMLRIGPWCGERGVYSRVDPGGQPGGWRSTWGLAVNLGACGQPGGLVVNLGGLLAVLRSTWRAGAGHAATSLTLVPIGNPLWSPSEDLIHALTSHLAVS